MDDRHVMRLIKAAERIATATEQIADTLKQMHAADPMAAINAAIEAETQKRAEEIEEQARAHVHVPTAYGAYVPPDQKWRLGQ
jgi:hypothetical protein